MTLDIITFKQYIPLVTIDDTRIQLYLDDARRIVVRDGFNESHEDFAILQKLATLSIMQEEKVAGIKSASSIGNNPEGINSIGVAGINIGFQNPSNSNTVFTKDGKTGYYLDYENLKKRIWAFGGRVA